MQARRTYKISLKQVVSNALGACPTFADCSSTAKCLSLEYVCLDMGFDVVTSAYDP